MQLGGGQGDVSAVIRYKGILDEAWQDSLALQAVSANRFNFTVQESMLDDIGFEFEVSFTDGITEVTRSNNTITKSFGSDQSDDIPFLQLSGKWQMFSIPYVLDDNLIETVFSQLGQLEYKFDWRLVHYDGAKYVDAGAGINRIELGKGYWINFDNASNRQIMVGSGAVNSAKPFDMPLRAGWNQVGNPYNVDIDWSRILLNNEATASIGDLIKFNPQTNSIQESGELLPFEGAFVWSDVARELKIDYLTSNSSRIVSSAEEFSLNIDEEKWELPLMLANTELALELGAIGMHPSANMMKDSFDEMSVPRFFDYTALYTTHKEYFYPYFKKDVRQTSGSSSWMFELASNQLNSTPIIEWDNSSFKHATKQLWLIDEENGVIVNMNQQNQYALNFNQAHKLSIHLTADINQRPLPFNLQLGNPYPNPTTGISNINILLPKMSGKYAVELAIYNASGTKIATVADGALEAGVHQYKVDLRDYQQVESGLYLFRLSVSGANGQTVFRKIILNK
jgi:hypothetical protein